MASSSAGTPSVLWGEEFLPKFMKYSPVTEEEKTAGENGKAAVADDSGDVTESEGETDYDSCEDDTEEEPEEESIEDMIARLQRSENNENLKVHDSLENHWTSPPGRLFSLRAKGYFAQEGGFTTNNLGYKQPSLSCAYETIGMAVFEGGAKLVPAIDKVAELKEFLAKMNGVDEAPGDAPQFLVTCFSFNNFFRTSFLTVVHIFKRVVPIDSKGDGHLDRTMTRFLESDDETKRQKFKFVPKFRHGSQSLRKAINMLGGERPVIIGMRLRTDFTVRDKVIEIDMDVGSSKVATMLYGLVRKTSGGLIVDYSFLIEGQKEDELPERLLGSIRWHHCTAEACAVPIDAEGNIVSK